MQRPALSLLALFCLPACQATVELPPPPEKAHVLRFEETPGFVTNAFDDLEENSDDVFEQEGMAGFDEAALRPRGVRPEDLYRGTCRKKAKLSFPNADVGAFDGIGPWLASLPSDDAMQRRGISRAADSGRTDPEQKMARVPAFVLACNRAQDGDYRLILGDHPTSPTVCLIAEISGLALMPEDNAYTDDAAAETLARVRVFWQERMGRGLPAGTRYKFYNPGIPVEVTGAAFYDSCQDPGQVGPRVLRPLLTTGWELHPVQSVRFVSVQ